MSFFDEFEILRHYPAYDICEHGKSVLTKFYIAVDEEKDKVYVVRPINGNDMRNMKKIGFFLGFEPTIAKRLSREEATIDDLMSFEKVPEHEPMMPYGIYISRGCLTVSPSIRKEGAALCGYIDQKALSQSGEKNLGVEYLGMPKKKCRD